MNDVAWFAVAYYLVMGTAFYVAWLIGERRDPAAGLPLETDENGEPRVAEAPRFYYLGAFGMCLVAWPIVLALHLCFGGDKDGYP